MSKHSFGPWAAVFEKAGEGGYAPWGIKDADGFWVANILDSGNGQGRHSEACARLIAAAPDLLEALKAIVDKDLTFFDGCVDRWLISYGQIQFARAAIKKAIGE